MLPAREASRSDRPVGEAPGEGEARVPQVAIEFVRPLAVGLRRFGVPATEFFDALGVPEDATGRRLSVVRLADVLHGIADRTGTPHLALEIVRMYPLGALGASDYCFSTSARLIEGLARIASHVGMFTEALRYELSVEGESARIEERHLFRPLRVLTELSSAFVARRLRDVLGEGIMKLTAVRFAHRALGPTAPYDSYFGVEVEFGAPADDVWFPRELLTAPLLTADPVLARMLREHPRVLTAPEPDAASPFVREVSAAIDAMLANGGGDLGVDAVGRRLGTSGRTLQRKLRDAGKSYSALLDEARRAWATKLLAREGSLLVDIAYRLGFHDVSAFFRAFRQWTGTSPRAFQRLRAAAAASRTDT